MITGEIQSLADAFRVTAALIRVQHSQCGDGCGGWLLVADWLDHVADEGGLSGRRQRRALEVACAYLVADRAEVPA